eukprot:g6590.t1
MASLDADKGKLNSIVKVYYDLKGNANISDNKKLQLLPSKEFSLDDTYTFKQLLIHAAKFWKISLGAVESRSVVLVNREGKEWDLTGKVSYLLRAKLTEDMRGVILRYHVPTAEQELVHEKKNIQMYDFNRVSNIDAFPDFKSQASGSLLSMPTDQDKLFETQHRLQQGPPPNYTAELWQIFAYYCVAGDPKELRLRMRSFIQFGHHCRLFRDQFTPEIMGVIYDENKTTSHASMSFDQFLNALVHIACNYLYVPTSRKNNNGDAIALGKLLLNDVLQYARKLSWGGGETSDWSARQAHIDNYEVQELFTKLKGPLQKMFKHYALIDGTFHRGSLSTMPLSLTGFRRFSREVGFWEVGIDAQDLAQVYFLTSTYHSEKENDNSITNDLHMLFYGTFLNAIGHCALLAFPRLYKLPDLSDPSAENDEVGPRVLKSLFQHMAWSISKIPADKRPSGGTSFVRTSMVLFRNVTKNGNADHLHMYKKIGVQNISEKKDINLSTHRVNTASKFFKGTSQKLFKRSNIYRSKVMSPNLESKHQNLITKGNYPTQQNVNEFSNDSHSMSGRYRVYDILSRTNVKRNSKSKGDSINKTGATLDATMKEGVMPSSSSTRSGSYKSTTKVNSASSSLNFSPTTTKIRLAMDLTSETNVDTESLISPQLAVRLASVMYGKGLQAELKHFHGSKWDIGSKVAEDFYRKGDANVLRVLKSLCDSDVESLSTNRILDAEEEKIDHVGEMDEDLKKQVQKETKTLKKEM